jgi:hypothetical protein
MMGYSQFMQDELISKLDCLLWGQCRRWVFCIFYKNRHRRHHCRHHHHHHHHLMELSLVKGLYKNEDWKHPKAEMWQRIEK